LTTLSEYQKDAYQRRNWDEDREHGNVLKVGQSCVNVEIKKKNDEWWQPRGTNRQATNSTKP
jgi:cation transport regulator ChaB